MAMTVKAVVGTDGKLGLFIADGSFADGKAKLEELLGILKASGLEFAEVGVVEQHKHDTVEAHHHVHADGTIHHDH